MECHFFFFSLKSFRRELPSELLLDIRESFYVVRTEAVTDVLSNQSFEITLQRNTIWSINFLLQLTN